MSLQYYGILNLPHSWAVVASAILLELQKRGHKFHCTSTNGFDSIHPNLKQSIIHPQIQTVGTQRRSVFPSLPTTTSLSYTIPQNLMRVSAKHKLLIYNYETTVLPEGWASHMNSQASLILPSSEFSKQIFATNGVQQDKMFVLPHGFDASIYNPEITPASIKGLDQDKFKFLTVAISHWRKGYDVLLKAYIEEFRNDDSVVLIIKTGRDPKEDTMPVHVDIRQIIAALRTTHKYQWPEIRIVESRFDNLARLYNACDAVVLPTRTECFSLTVLEAAACNKPIITTNYGGHLDFLNKANSNLIDCSMRLAPPEGQYWKFYPQAQCAEPDVEHLKQLMRNVKTNYQEAQLKAKIAYEQVVKKYTWQQVVDSLLAEMSLRDISL